jgi:hypothetical protein
MCCKRTNFLFEINFDLQHSVQNSLILNPLLNGYRIPENIEGDQPLQFAKLGLLVILLWMEGGLKMDCP